MPDLRLAATLALEALERIDQADNDCDFLNPSQCYQLDKAMSALRAALEEQPAEQEPEGSVCGRCGGLVFDPVLPQPAKQPLTDEQIDALELPPSGTATVRDLVRLIERAHGIGEQE